jgi:hypothetical protein
VTRSLLYLSILLSFAGSGLAQPAGAVPAQPSAHPAASHPMSSADAVWADLVAGNKRFVAGKPRPYELVAIRRKLASSIAVSGKLSATTDSTRHNING